jgi:hypothetical protein
MFNISIKVSNETQKVVTQIREMRGNLIKGIRKGFYDIGKDLVSDAKKYIDEPKHGRQYLTRVGRAKFKRYTWGAAHSIDKLKAGRVHIASAPGEAPAILTGRLKRSVDFLVVGADRLDYGVFKERYGCDYAKYLEYKDLVRMIGGTESKRIAPRPFISRAYKENREKIPLRIEQAIKQELNK